MLQIIARILHMNWYDTYIIHYQTYIACGVPCFRYNTLSHIYYICSAMLRIQYFMTQYITYALLCYGYNTLWHIILHNMLCYVTAGLWACTAILLTKVDLQLPASTVEMPMWSCWWRKRSRSFLLYRNYGRIGHSNTVSR